MAKKSKSSKKRKQRKPNVPVYAVPAEAQEESPVAKQAAPAVGSRAPISNPLASSTATTESIDWAKEYPFFAPDMKKFGIIVLLMVVLLLALNFVFIYML